MAFWRWQTFGGMYSQKISSNATWSGRIKEKETKGTRGSRRRALSVDGALRCEGWPAVGLKLGSGKVDSIPFGIVKHSMSPQNHEKYRICPPKNHVIYERCLLDHKPLLCQGLIVIRLVRNPQEQNVHHFAMINFHRDLPNNTK